MSKKLAERFDRFKRRCDLISDTINYGESKTSLRVIPHHLVEGLFFFSTEYAGTRFGGAVRAADEISNALEAHLSMFPRERLRHVVRCSIAHAFFESRLNYCAVNKKGKAVGLFQFTPSGLGNKSINGGMRIYKPEMTVAEYRNSKDEGYDAMDIEIVSDIFAKSFLKLFNRKFSKNGLFMDADALHIYSMMYWSPLCGGGIRKADLIDSEYTRNKKDKEKTVTYLVDHEGYIIPSSIVFKTFGGNVKIIL